MFNRVDNRTVVLGRDESGARVQIGVGEHQGAGSRKRELGSRLQGTHERGALGETPELAMKSVIVLQVPGKRFHRDRWMKNRVGEPQLQLGKLRHGCQSLGRKPGRRALQNASNLDRVESLGDRKGAHAESARRQRVEQPLVTTAVPGRDESASGTRPAKGPAPAPSAALPRRTRRAGSDFSSRTRGDRSDCRARRCMESSMIACKDRQRRPTCQLFRPEKT